MKKEKAKFKQLKNVNVKVIIRGYDKKLDCIEQTEAHFFTEKEKKQIIKITENFLKKRVKEKNKK